MAALYRGWLSGSGTTPSSTRMIHRPPRGNGGARPRGDSPPVRAPGDEEPPAEGESSMKSMIVLVAGAVAAPALAQCTPAWEIVPNTAMNAGVEALLTVQE